MGRADEVLAEGSVASKRLGVVGRKKAYSTEERIKMAEKLMGTTQIALAKKLGIHRHTLPCVGIELSHMWFRLLTEQGRDRICDIC